MHAGEAGFPYLGHNYGEIVFNRLSSDREQIDHNGNFIYLVRNKIL
jgi:hypothetical protein